MSAGKEEQSRWVLYGIDNDLKNELKIYAIRNNKKIGSLVESILKDWLDKQKENNKE